MKEKNYKAAIERQEKLLELLKIYPHALYEDMLNYLGTKSVKTIQRTLKRLEEGGRIHRIKLGKKTVKYEVIEQVKRVETVGHEDVKSMMVQYDPPPIDEKPKLRWVEQGSDELIGEDDLNKMLGDI